MTTRNRARGRTVFKVQRPLMTNNPDRPWRAYNHNRSRDIFMAEAAVPADLRALMGSELKIYVEADTAKDSQGRVVLVGATRAPVQPW